MSTRLGEQLCQRGNMFRRRLRQHAMPEIENEGSASRACARISRTARSNDRPADQQRDRVEIALHRQPRACNCSRAKPSGTDVSIADRIDAGFRRVALDRKARQPRGNPMIGTAGNICFSRVDDLSRRFDDPALKAGFRQDPGPTVKQLHSVDPGLDLPRQVDNCWLRRSARSAPQSPADRDRPKP